jgi:hypothetical protein
MGFHRQGMPAVLDRAAVTAVITRYVAEELAFLNRTADPFGIAHDCRNPAGHDFISSCGDLACVHCGRIAWA